MRIKKIITFAILFLMVGLWASLKYKLANYEAVVLDQEEKNKVLYLFAVSDYFPETVLKRFEEKYKCKVQYDYFSGNEELLSKLQAGAVGYDVLVPSDFIVQALVASQFLQELDKTLLPNLKYISKEFINPPYDPESKYTVPYKWGTTGFVYNTKKVKEKLEAWDQVFQEKYSGKIALLDDMREAIGSQLISLGFSVNTTLPEELKKAREVMIKRKKIIKAFSGDPRQILLSGDVWIAQAYSGDALQVISEKPEFKYVIAREGGVIWVDTLAVFKNSQQKELAHQFINFILDPENEKETVRKIKYSSPHLEINNENIDEMLKPNYVNKLNLIKLEFLKDLGIDGQKWDQIWTEVKSD